MNYKEFPCILVNDAGLYLLALSEGHGIVVNDKHTIYQRGMNPGHGIFLILNKISTRLDYYEVSLYC
jgi:hypothetical protein